VDCGRWYGGTGVFWWSTLLENSDATCGALCFENSEHLQPSRSFRPRRTRRDEYVAAGGGSGGLLYLSGTFGSGVLFITLLLENATEEINDTE